MVINIRIIWKACESKDPRVSGVVSLGPENLYLRQDAAGPETTLKTIAIGYEGHFRKPNNFIGRYGKFKLKNCFPCCYHHCPDIKGFFAAPMNIVCLHGI